MKILLLSGTREGRELAQRLRPKYQIVESVAGRTDQATGDRVGGFGGQAGLADYLKSEKIDLLVDATHPFAATMTNNAAAACQQTGMPWIRLERPGWRDHPDAKDWCWVDSHEAASQKALELAGGGVVLLTVGRQPLKYYLSLPKVWARVAQWKPEGGFTVPDGWQILEERGPFALEDELELLKQIAVLVSKDSGGKATAAKLTAAAQLQVPVVMVARPATPESAMLVKSVAEAEDLIQQLDQSL